MCITIEEKDISILLANNAGRPSTALVKLLKTLNIENNKSFKNILDMMQKNWIRGQDKERWQIEDKYQDKKDVLIPLFEQLRLLSDIKSTQFHYTYALILGGLLPAVRKRMAFLTYEWKRGVRFDEIILLGSSRPLLPDRESPEILKDKNDSDLPARPDWEFDGNLPTNEIEMMEFVFKQAQIPEDLRKTKIVSINSPNIRDKNGNERRAGTADTFNAWINETKPVSGSSLIISSQPFVGYQHEVALLHLPPTFQLETVGPGFTNFQNIKVGVILDNIARWAYNVNQRLEKAIKNNGAKEA
ncbi:13950_t:CDS:1 [Acaulospora colombiana]|uniref:13950_t:CDS:1 n=1 Tax=Acaulospora colombiana TaxID=27376 RepID=A0ACA9K0Y1_9GLOM|nr:13950_t:CDS:1 [Acaulospora colombiana]